MMNRIIGIICFTFIFCHVNVHAQDSTLLDLLKEGEDVKPTNVISGTFKATQIINTPSIESPASKELQFMIMHRFGRINEGGYALFGLDNATIRFALDYGITDKLALGIGRSSFEKVYDASLKWKVIQQTEHGKPVSVSVFGLLANTRLRYSDKPYLDTKFRTMYTAQLLVARKFNSNLSIQLTPSWVHFNVVPTPQDNNDVFALGIGGRMKVSKRISINGEYNYLVPDQIVSYNASNSLSGGIDIETGGHVFQFVFSNSQGMISPYYLARTDGQWGKGDIYFGFNITRIFSFKKSK